MKEKPMLKTEIRRVAKATALAPLYDKVRRASKKIRINDFWDDPIANSHYSLGLTWNTRAYFLQDFKRFAPEDIEVHKAQKSGTFATSK